ncbi:ubiquitin-conjugating enzyme E2 J1-like [Anneissia japonica]|uniref:ubiquitin-conjugating enzyme E2 J1-like n=1 Tax=Anneissia japonica TaxID=1529436 RepID=UPI001425AC01|nr:ubiquitin-conjugating enzyme E2 J1-like [Anneissia japonica]
MAQQRFSNRCPAVKRLMKEAQELREPTEQYCAFPLEDNLFEWHFTLRGPSGSEYEGGVYHGRITFPPEYPMKPPSIMLLTPTGRFKVAMNICLSISGHHPETWQPSWSIRTVLLAIMGFMPTHGGGAIGSLDYTPEERKVLAKKSMDWQCPVCKVKNKDILPLETSKEKSEETKKEAAILVAKVQLKKQKDEEESRLKSVAQTVGAEHPALVNGNPGVISAAASNNAATSPTSSSTTSSIPSSSSTTTPISSTSPLPTSQSSSLPSSQSSFPSVNPPVIHRRPVAASTQPGAAAPAARATQAPARPQQQGSNRVFSFILMVVISLAIVLLIMRRLYITYEYKFDTEL